MKFDGRVLPEWPPELTQGKQLIRQSGKPRDAWHGTYDGQRVLIKRDHRARVALSVNEMKPLFDLKSYEAVMAVADPDVLIVKWHDDSMDLGRLGKGWARKDAWVDEFWKMILFDQINSMGDRYEANVLALANGDLIAIDEISAWMWDRPINRMYGKLVNSRLLDRKGFAKDYCTRVQRMGMLGWAMVDSVLGRYWTPEIVQQVRVQLELRTKDLHQFLWKLIGRMIADVRVTRVGVAGGGGGREVGKVPEVRKAAPGGPAVAADPVQQSAVRVPDVAASSPPVRDGAGGAG